MQVYREIIVSSKGWLKTDGTDPESINDDIYTNGKTGISTDIPQEKLHVKGAVLIESETGRTAINIGIAEYFDTTREDNIYYHLRLPYRKPLAGEPVYNRRYHLHVVGYSNASRTAIDIRFIGFLFSQNGIIGAATTIIHNSKYIYPITGGQYIGLNNFVYCWFKLPRSNTTNFSVDSLKVGFTPVLKTGEIIINQTSTQFIL